MAEVAEIFRDIGFKRRLIALERKQIITAVGDNPTGDPGLGAHGVNGHEGACKLAVPGKLVE